MWTAAVVSVSCRRRVQLAVDATDRLAVSRATVTSISRLTAWLIHCREETYVVTDTQTDRQTDNKTDRTITPRPTEGIAVEASWPPLKMLSPVPSPN